MVKPTLKELEILPPETRKSSFCCKTCKKLAGVRFSC